MTSKTTKRRKATTPATPAPITVYEVKAGQHTHQVQASNTQQLRDQLAKLIPKLSPYALQAASYLAATERAIVQGQGQAWALRRLGVLQFVPDAPNVAEPVQATPPAPESKAEGKTQEQVEQQPTEANNGQEQEQPEVNEANNDQA